MGRTGRSLTLEPLRNAGRGLSLLASEVRRPRPKGTTEAAVKYSVYVWRQYVFIYKQLIYTYRYNIYIDIFTYTFFMWV